MAVGIFILGFSTSGQGAEIKEKERLAIVKALKNKGDVGENNKGLLEFRTDDRKAEEVVQQENSARTERYKEIAGKTGTTLDKVGEQRAKQILEEDPPKTWHQTLDGKWFQKK